MVLTEAEINTLGNALMGELCDVSIQKRRTIALKAGVDISEVPSEQNSALVNPALGAAFAKLDTQRKLNALPIIADQLIVVNGGMVKEELTWLLKQHGYQYLDGHFLPIGLIDEREKQFMPTSAVERISTAINRLADGDESGAVTSACGAVDTVTLAIYARHQNWGPPPDSFQAKINTVMKQLEIFEEMEKDLREIGLKDEDAQTIRNELHKATKHAAEALQVIRRTLGDVHGKKPAYKRLTYESIKWASAICGLLEGKIP
jgi:hypothetical protein